MDTNHGHENGEPRNPSVGFDKSDLSARGILIFFLVLALSAVAVHFGVLGMYVGMTKIAEQHDTELSPLAPRAVAPKVSILTNTTNINVQKFPDPRLENDSTELMTKFLLQETAALTADPWRDAQGNVHLPIDQAIKVAATRLPMRAGGTVLPNYPGVGREYSNPQAQDEGAAQSSESAHEQLENSPAAK